MYSRRIDRSPQEAVHDGTILAVRAMLDSDHAALATEMQNLEWDIVTECVGDHAAIRRRFAGVLDGVGQIAAQHPELARLAWLTARLKDRVANPAAWNDGLDS